MSLDKSLIFSEHVSSKINNANLNLWIMFRAFTNMDKDMFLNLFQSIVRPHLEYAVTDCMPLYKKKVDAIENVQLKESHKTSLNHKPSLSISGKTQKSRTPISGI